MFVHERQAAILDHVGRWKRLGVDDLRRRLRVSRSTLRRDLVELEARGEVVRVHGGVVSPQHLRGESTLARRGGQNAEAKRRIARLAAGTIPPNASVLIDAGTTCLAAGRLLLGRDDLKLFTHSVPLVAAALEADAPARVTCLGGELRAAGGSLVGGMTDAWLGRLRCDVALVGASGLDADGPSTTEVHEAGVKAELIRRSRRRLLLCDADKCGSPAAVKFAGWGEFDAWIVDRRPPSSYRGAVDVRVARS